jgi:hypothetical protein
MSTTTRARLQELGLDELRAMATTVEVEPDGLQKTKLIAAILKSEKFDPSMVPETEEDAEAPATATPRSDNGQGSNGQGQKNQQQQSHQRVAPARLEPAHQLHPPVAPREAGEGVRRGVVQGVAAAAVRQRQGARRVAEPRGDGHGEHPIARRGFHATQLQQLIVH